MKIKSITKLPQKQMTVDIEVEDTHSYQLENGAVVHNTTSKLFGLCEGWHLPSMAWYIRYVQFRDDAPEVQEYKDMGYPTIDLKSYQGTTVVGFPTALEITNLGMEDKIVLAGDATMEEQYKWLMLGEKYWINGVEEDGSPIAHRGNQISYTLKYNPETVDFKQYCDTMKQYQSQVRCCSVMPQIEAASYEYQPETRVTLEEYQAIEARIKKHIEEDIDAASLACSSGACPIDVRDDRDMDTLVAKEQK